MKHLLYFIPFVATALLSNAADTIISSGNWSDDTIWASGKSPTTSSSAPLDSLIFGESGLTLRIDTSSDYVTKIDIGSIAVSTIDIAAGQTFHWRQNSGVNFFSASSKDSVLNINGDGSLLISTASGQINANGGILNFNTATTASGGSIYFTSTFGGTVNFNQNFTTNNQISVGYNYTLNIASGVTASASSAFNVWGNSSVLNMAQGSKLTSGGGTYIASGKIEGDVVSNGVMNWDTTKFGIRLGSSSTNVVEITSTASITQKYSSSNLPSLLGGKLISNAGDGKISLDAKFMLQKNSSLILNTSNAFRTRTDSGLATSQADSDFYIVNYSTSTSGGTKYSASSSTITLNAANDFGSFILYGGSTLTFNLNGNHSIIGIFTSFDSAVTDLSKIVVTDLTDFTLKLMDISNLTSENIELYYMDGSTEKEVVFVEDTIDGGYWVNTQAIPEPSTVAGIIASLALSVAIYRRRK